jgi:hypothetical protein
MADKFSKQDVYVETGYDNIILIDPNKVTSTKTADGEPRLVEHENLVYYANLETKIIPRTKLAIGESYDTNPVVNTTIASFAGGDEDLNINFLKPKGKKAFDSSWTDQITGKGSRQGKAPNQTSEYATTFDGKTQYRRKTLNYEDTQMLGIKSISVKITPAGTPTVNMTLVDVQGRTLFEQGDNSMYSVFFNLPYPIFYLTIKGYYGKAIRLQLTLRKFNAKFSPDNGNFEIDIELIGRLNALLFDSLVGYARNAPKMLPRTITKNVGKGKNTTKTTQVNTYLGRQKLEEVYKQYKDKKLIDPDFDEIDIDELIFRLENYTKAQKDRTAKADFQIINKIADFRDNINNLKSVVFSYTKSKFLNLTKTFIVGDQVNYTFIDSISKTDRTNIINNIEQACKVYLEKLEKNAAFGKTPNQVPIDQPDGTKKSFNLTISPFNYNGVNAKNLVVEKQSLSTFKSNIDWLKTYRYRNRRDPINNELNEFISKEEAALGSIEKVWNGSSIVTEDPYFFKFGEPTTGTPDFTANSFLDILKKAEDTLSSQEKLIEENLTYVLSSVSPLKKGPLGFEPTIRNIFCVLIAGVDAFFKLMDDVHERAWDQRKNSKRLDLIINGRLGPDAVKKVEVSTGTLSNEAIVYPWPLYYEKTTDKNGRELYEVKYPGTVVTSNDWDIWPELEFTEGYLDAANSTFSPAPINNYNNNANQLKYVSFNAIEFPFKYIPYNNLQPAVFFYEVFERCFLNTNYTKFVRNTGINGLSDLIGEFESENIFESIQNDNTLVTNFKNKIKTYTDLIDELKNNTSKTNFTNFQSNNFITQYIVNEIINKDNIYSVDTISSNAKTIISGEKASEKIKDYLKDTRSNKLSFLDTFPFTNVNWLKNNLYDGVFITNVESPNETISSFDYDVKKRVVSRLTDTVGGKKISALTDRFGFFNGSQLPLATPGATLKYSINSRNDLKSFYFQRSVDYRYFTENQIDYGSSYSGQVNEKVQTTSFLNTPYFVNSIVEGVKKEKQGDKNPYTALGYLFLNSLPLISTRHKLKTINSDGKTQTDIDYLYATLNKFSAIHQLPYAWILKYGSIWHRYKTWVDSNFTIDILDNVWTDIDYKNIFDPITNSTTKTYNLFDFNNNPLTHVLQTSQTQNVNGQQANVTVINLGLYPKLMNDVYYYFTNKDLFDGTYTPDSLSAITTSKKIKIGKNNDATFSFSLSGDSTEKNRMMKVLNFFEYMDCEGNVDVGVGQKSYLLFPSCGGIDINQAVWESYNELTNKKEELLDNKKMYNGSVRTLWGVPNYGYFDNSLIKKPTPSEYLLINNPNFSIAPPTLENKNIKLANIEEIFNIFDPKTLDLFEGYFLGFCDKKTPINNIVLDGEDNSKGTKNQEQKSLLEQLKKIFFVDKNNISVSTEDQTGFSLLENQINSMTKSIGEFLNFECILKLGNPGNFNRLYFNDFTDDITYIPLKGSPGAKLNYGTYGNNLPPDVTLVISQSQRIEAWKELYKYIGDSTEPKASLTDPNSYVFNFFKEFNVDFNEDNVKNLSQLIKIYVTKKIEDSTYNNTNFLQDLKDYLNKVNNENEDTINATLSKLNGKLKNANVTNKLTNQTPNTYGDVLKLETYTVFKNLNDKWIAGSDFKNRLLFEDFLFHDRANVDIGDELTVETDKLLGQLKNQDKKSIMDLLSNILTDNNLIFFALPSYINFYGIKSAVINNQTIPVEIPNSMFGTYLNVDYLNSKPKFLCIYVGKQSEHLQTSDTTFSKFGDDSFDMRNSSTNPLRVPASNIDYEKSSPVVGFNVDFGILNQNIFRDVSLDMSEKKNTAETFAVNEQLGKAGAGDSVAQQSVSLYSIYKSRSYTCDVKSMGCAVIQPTMYFNLRHVPLFRGPYWITEVSHSISERGFDTSFKGVRMPLFSLPKPESFLMGVNKNFTTKWKKEILASRKPDTNPVSTYVVNLSTAPNNATNAACIGATTYTTKPFITNVKTTITDNDLVSALSANTSTKAIRAWLFGIAKTFPINTAGGSSVTCNNNNLFGITCLNNPPALDAKFTEQTCVDFNGSDTPIPCFVDIIKPIEYMEADYKTLFVGSPTFINNLYSANTVSSTLNDPALSAYTGTTDIKVLRLACALNQLKIMIWESRDGIGLTAEQLYDKVKLERTSGTISDIVYAYNVEQMIKGVNYFYILSDPFP